MPKKLLIVEDEASMRGFYSRLFSCGPYSFTLAGTLAEAKGLMSENSYDLLITDMELGDGCGTELVDLANGTGGTKSIIISGSYEPPELRALAMNHGAHVCFSKPFNTEDLLKAVTGLLTADAPTAQ